MQASLMAVLLDAVEGKEDEFSDFYTNVHIRDVMRLPGSVAVQRFIQSGAKNGTPCNPQRFLAIYEIADKKACTKGHHDDVFTPRMPISPDVDLAGIQEAYYDSVCSSKSGAYGEGIDGPMIIVRLNAIAGDDVSFKAEWSEKLVSIASLPGFTGVQLFRRSEEQMYALPSSHEYLALFRVSSVSIALPAWRNYQSAQEKNPGATDWANAIVASYEPLFPRLTAQAVIHPSPEAAAEEKRARLEVGNGMVATLPAI